MSFEKPYLENYPNSEGFFGEFGGSFVPPAIQEQLIKISEGYERISKTQEWKDEIDSIFKEYQGRPTPITYAKRLTDHFGGAKIYLKREDLNHMGSHKMNHCTQLVLLAKKLGYKKVIAETGAGQHGVSLAAAAAFLDLPCTIYMGKKDMEKEYPNVLRMKILGAKVVPATEGLQTLKEAVDLAFAEYMKDPETIMYCIGSVVGPHPFPKMVRDFQRVVGRESREQFKKLTDGELPGAVVACCGGGSNAMGIFSGFIDDESVKLCAVEPLGKGSGIIGEHAASNAFGKTGVLHGFKSTTLTDSEGNAAPVHSIASGLDYPSVGPEHAFLYSIGREEPNVGATDDEAIKAFFTISKLEGIIPALESSHALAYAFKIAPEMKGQSILINVSGRGDKDLEYVVNSYPEYIDC
ncbi:unnamed protein product [[Candida] boidinii]|nr:hypothetical protein BVG19_g4142 [[Candida] boidinii]OWB51134.1 hypothetical protein B5S27_g2692 [[Candida] boidinii]OWB69179.1 hypothetical protein B5S30_g4579 [[Candida] boidinii]OWB86423.1 hypothetical protein B5S33_g5118 [[Candida] boidinii]GMF02632.1 unnamed protein product [[Candida] boidinii]